MLPLIHRRNTDPTTLSILARFPSGRGSVVDQQRRDQIELRWQEIYSKIAEAERTGESPLTGVDAAFYCGQLLEELDELEFELGLAYFEESGQVTELESDCVNVQRSARYTHVPHSSSC
jgi:hypothetical protein